MHDVWMIVVAVLVTAATRFIPFLIFRKKESTPAIITYLGQVLPCAIIGLIFSIIANSKAKNAGTKNGCAVAGLVCSIIALVITAIAYVLVYTVFADLLTEIGSEIGADFFDYY